MEDGRAVSGYDPDAMDKEREGEAKGERRKAGQEKTA